MPIPQPRASRNKDRVNYRELAGIKQNAKRGLAVATKRGFVLRASRAKLDNIPTVPLGVREALNRSNKDKRYTTLGKKAILGR